MNIDFVARRFYPAPGGLENQLFEITKRLARRGHQITILCSDLHSDIPFRRMKETDLPLNEGIKVERFRAFPVPRRASQGSSMAPGILISFLSKRAAPLVHCHGLNLISIPSGIVAKMAGRSKVLLSTHADPSLLLGGPMTKAFETFDGIIALTEYERKRLVALGCDPLKVYTIPNGLSLESFENLPERDSFTRRRRLSGRMILYVGRLDRNKGCDTIIEALPSVQERVGECTAVFVGPDWGYKNHLVQLSAKRGVKTLFTGLLDREQLNEAFVASDVFVYPTTQEAFGVSILEAMICGAPVVAAQVGGVPTLVRHRETGLLIPPRNPNALADAISQVLKDGFLRSRIVTSARNMASEYTIDKTVEQLEELYSRVVEG
jgi:glycosyltransferase involved in cell wall biosynthesis